MAITARHMRVTAIEPLGGPERINPAWTEKREQLEGEGKTEAEAIAQLEAEAIPKLFPKPAGSLVTLVNDRRSREVLHVLVTPAELPTMGQVFVMSLT